MLRLLSFSTAVLTLLAPSMSLTAAATDNSFIFAGCSSLKFTPDSPYESDLNSLLTTIVNSALYATYGNSTAGSVHGLFQCRGDLPAADCARCVARAVAQLGPLCLDSCGGALQLDACLVRYDNASFVGAQDRTVMVSKCGPSGGGDKTVMLQVLDYLGASGGAFRAAGPAVAQCVGDLSPSDCQDCFSDAIGRLKTECASASAAWGLVFLGKCYARYSRGGTHSNGDREGNNDDETEKTLAILIGLIAAVTLLIVFLSFLRKSCERGPKGGK